MVKQGFGKWWWNHRGLTAHGLDDSEIEDNEMEEELEFVSNTETECMISKFKDWYENQTQCFAAQKVWNSQKQNKLTNFFKISETEHRTTNQSMKK